MSRMLMLSGLQECVSNPLIGFSNFQKFAKECNRLGKVCYHIKNEMAAVYRELYVHIFTIGQEIVRLSKIPYQYYPKFSLVC